MPAAAERVLRGEAIDLYTSRWANRELAHLCCQPVGISRGTPKFPVPYRYRIVRELAPSREAFGLDDPREFEAAYRAQLEEIGLETVLERLERISREAGGLPLALLCFEPADQFCHRRTLAESLRAKTGIAVPELGAGDLPERPNVPQMRLF